MIGFIFLLLAARQIYIIIKNGLTARQIKEASTGEGVLVLIEVKNSDFLEPSYLSHLESIKEPHKLYMMAPLDHPQILEFSNRSLQLKTFNPEIESVVDVINNVCLSEDAASVLVSDSNIIFNSEGLFGLEKQLKDSKGPFCIIPQVHSSNLTVDCLYTLNPNLALISLFSFKRLTRSLKHPLLNATQLSFAFRKQDFETFMDDAFWKSSLLYSFRARAIGVKLCFGEKFFSVLLTPDLNSLWQKMGKVWQETFKTQNYSTLSLLIQTLIWSFPALFFKSHPFYALLILFLLLIYRIFTVIIFQENVISILIHPFAGLMWLGSFLWDRFNHLKNRSR